MKKYQIEIKWAIIFAIISLLWMWLEESAGLHGKYIDKHALYTNFYAIPVIAVYVLALLDKRKNRFQGKMNFKQGFGTGVFITLLVTALTPLIQYITHEFITPQYFKNIISYSIENNTMATDKAHSYFSLENYIKISAASALLLGIATSAVVALVVKKK